MENFLKLFQEDEVWKLIMSRNGEVELLVERESYGHIFLLARQFSNTLEMKLIIEN